ncbi:MULTISPECIES: ComF family protein [unclassified Paenibacillus]|uniref:ComF family protein n=1 Tax=unclassified Paenibacillus TaxID=185978 RepID=UPI001C0FB369|nr:MULTISPECIES: ComF family protein [unclassified Paenibacillus]MBU5440977.1 ComF family protein [Paenibacillus sp. MSJ-34]CAH0118023.1 hypothetical protein PAE9249_00488 [Paenibacillus sp. CECT 9249]
MIGGWKERWRWLNTLLRARQHPCMICGKSAASLFYGICDGCGSVIPWIDRVNCTVCGRHVPCPDCIRRPQDSTYFIQNRSAVQYDSHMKEWLAQYKYRGNERYIGLFVHMLNQAYVRMLNEIRMNDAAADDDAIFDCVTFVPVSEARLAERGFNQAEQLAKGLAAIHRLPVYPLIRRARHTAKQSFKARGERIRDLKDVFVPDSAALSQIAELARSRRSEDKPLLRILLVDDVYTTGSTVNECARQIRTIPGLAGFPEMRMEVYCLTWARS